MKTPEKIKTGLECCHQPVCPKDCPYNKPDGICEMTDDLEAYVKQLEADNAELRRDRYAVCDTCDLRVLGHRTPVPCWISVKERMPEGEVLAADFAPGTYGYMDYIIGYVFPEKFAGPEGCYAENDHEILHHVTHWMTLPEPPKEE